MSSGHSVAVVTGAGGGLGGAVASLLARNGWLVLAADLVFPAAADETIDQLQVDVTDEAALADLAGAAARRGRIGAWINAAGISGTMSSFADTSLDDLERVLAVNLTGSFLGMRTAMRAAQKQQSPVSIVNFGSVASFVGAASGPAYPIAKHGVIGLTRCGAIEAAPTGSRVNAICPGPIDAGMYRGYKDLPTPDGLTLHDHMMSAIPLGRAGRADDVAEAALWLVGEDASYVNGAAFVLDGGMLASAAQGFSTLGDRNPSQLIGRERVQ